MVQQWLKVLSGLALVLHYVVSASLPSVTQNSTGPGLIVKSEIHAISKNIVLNVTWPPPSRNVSFQLVTVSLVNVSDNYCTKDNQTLQEDSVNLDSNQTSVLVPRQDLTWMHGLKMLLRHECTYLIKLETMSNNRDEDTTLETFFTVPGPGLTVKPEIHGISKYIVLNVTWPPPSRRPGLTVKPEIHGISKYIVLNVTWSPPSRNVSFQLVTVSLVNVSDNYCTKDNQTLQEDSVNLDSNQTSVLVPNQDVTWMHGLKMLLRQECTYLIKLETMSNNRDEDTTLETFFTVPECVEMKCRCYADQIPRVSSLSKNNLPSGDVNVTWKISAGNWRKIAVKLRKKYDLNNESVFKDTWHKDVNTSSVAIPKRFLEPGQTFRLQAEAIIQSDCRGQPTEMIFNVSRVIESEEDPEEPKVVLITALLVLTLVIAVFCAAAAMFWRRCGAWSRRLQPIHRWHTIYKAVSVESRLSRATFPALQERNVLYVEKEIEDAKARGEADHFEVSYSRLQLGRQIGKGAFGRVFLARAHAIAGTPGFMTVAVKKLKHRASSEEMDEFLSEIAMLKRVGRHPNIVTMLGCCTLQEPFCMLMEYIPCGDLLQYLRRLRVEYERCSHKPSPRYVDLLLGSTSDSDASYIQPETQHNNRPSSTQTQVTMLSWDAGQKLKYVLDAKELHSFALQIARGMSHLEKKQITHRDLAARNVLIDENKTLKISDFGLSRSGIYVNTRRNKVPLRWLSVEAMREHLYSNKSDVWAFGVVLWEIGTLGGFPYPTVEDMNLLRFLLDGKRLDKPDNCTDELYAMMMNCWSHHPDDRPSFVDLVTHLESTISHRQVYVDFRALPGEYVLPPTTPAGKLSNKD